MRISLADRIVELSGHEFAGFALGPLGGTTSRYDPWRAQIGQMWHSEMRNRLAAANAEARFEVPFNHAVHWKGWRMVIQGRIDQLLPQDGRQVVREIKTVSRPLPTSEDELSADHPEHFYQLAAYQCAMAKEDGDAAPGVLVLVEPASGFVQEVAQTSAAARARFETRLDEIWNFAERRRSSLERLRSLRFAPAFPAPRPGQETVVEDLRAAGMLSPVVFFEAPTGFGKTGSVLEYALGELADGRLSRLIYLTGKSTGQIQIVKQLDAMLGDPPGATCWQIRNKAEHCINEVYHCFRDACSYLDGQEERWPASGLQRFGQDATLPRDIETLRRAGREAAICPYEITRAGLPFTDIWIGDFNYVFAPANRSLLENIPGFDPAHTLLVVDEAHNLPARVADNHSIELSHVAARQTLAALHGTGASSSLVVAWERLTMFLARLTPADVLDPAGEAELRDVLHDFERQSQNARVDYPSLGPAACDVLFRALEIGATGCDERNSDLPRLVWVPEAGVVRSTCLDARAAIAATVAAYGRVIFLSATFPPAAIFAQQCGLEGLDIVPRHFPARAPWRENAYQVAVDARVDTRYQKRARYFRETADTLAAMHAAGSGPVAAFFPSYAYAKSVLREIEKQHPALRAAMQPRQRNLAAQQAFIEEALLFSDLLLLVLGSSFSEGIDLLGGRLAGAVVVGPALPEVNAVRRAALDASRAPTRDAAFREVYQIPGMQKVNQALGRLVRAPGQQARVLLHCRRFAEPSYHELLASEYQQATTIRSTEEFDAWLAGSTADTQPE